MINHNLKFLYTHYPKCAGTTVRKHLMAHHRAGVDDEIEKVHYRHCSLEVTLNRLNELGLDPDDYFKFSFCRNPWELCISEYVFWKTTLPEHHKKIKKPLMRKSVFCINYPFKDYLSSEFCYSNFDSIYTLNGDFYIDFVLKKESLQQDFNQLCSILDIEGGRLSIENTTKHDYYTTYYDAESIDIVAKKYKKEIDQFSYDFN